MFHGEVEEGVICERPLELDEGVICCNISGERFGGSGFPSVVASP